MVGKVASNCKFELLAIDIHIHVPFNTNVLADEKDYVTLHLIREELIICHRH